MRVVVVDEKTHNVTPVNCFSSRSLGGFPCEVDFHLVAWLADGMGEMLVEVMVQRLDTLVEVFRVERSMHFDNPLKDKRFFAFLRNCPIPAPGQYVVSLLVDGELVAHRKIRFW